MEKTLKATHTHHKFRIHDPVKLQDINQHDQKNPNAVVFVYTNNNLSEKEMSEQSYR